MNIRNLKFILVIFVLIASVGCKKSKETKNLTLNSASTTSDAYFVDYAPSVNTNYGSDEKIFCSAWTYSSTNVKGYFLLKFDYSSIGSGATIKSAKLNLHANTTSYFPTGSGTETIGHYGPQSSTDLSWGLKRVTGSWDESTVTYTTRPTTTESNKLQLSSPTAYNTSYIDIDVTQLVKDQVSNGNYGFEASFNNYTPYKRLNFYSSDYSTNASLVPSLTIEYEQ